MSQSTHQSTDHKDNLKIRTKHMPMQKFGYILCIIG